MSHFRLILKSSSIYSTAKFILRSTVIYGA
ncbi:unnamed protein product [Penicillium camemberti]|uniref:Str. FM013 n=1 Tax=Penicillium camemberti (strain FM 013) TaxID=1429867 RepID=A0A0G4PAN5_PENC3|nr:unnamed protein product [Penicillium camemberti]